MSTTVNNTPNVSKLIIERLQTLDDLPHFPDALMKLERILSSGEPLHLDDLVQLVAKDFRLAAGLIEVVNSAKYWSGKQVTDLSEAVSRIGTQDVRLMAHAINYKSTLKSKPPFSEKHFLRHSLLSAFVAQALAKALHINPGEAFLCGLMHDIGIYLLGVEDREKYIKVMQLIDYDIDLLVAAELQVYETHHAMMSARLLQHWEFPKAVILGVANHHSPSRAPEAVRSYAYLTYLAERAAFLLGVENGVADLSEAARSAPDEAMQSALDYFGLAYESFDELIQSAFETAQQSEMI
jgi:putative nucleotidyltransferase with HDIG domain